MDGEPISVLGPGDSFGELALLLDQPRAATVRARTAARLFRLNREGFDRLVAEAFRKGSLNPSAPIDRAKHH
jgi:cAMP-dependent protein kinase regulator